MHVYPHHAQLRFLIKYSADAENPNPTRYFIGGLNALRNLAGGNGGVVGGFGIRRAKDERALATMTVVRKVIYVYATETTMLMVWSLLFYYYGRRG